MARSRTLGGVVDQLYALREKRLSLQRQADLIEERERALRTELFKLLAEAGTTIARGNVATASRYLKSIAVVKDQQLLLTHARKTDAWDLLRVTAVLEACRERWNDGKLVPGVEHETVVKLSLTKNPKKGG